MPALRILTSLFFTACFLFFPLSSPASSALPLSSSPSLSFTGNTSFSQTRLLHALHRYQVKTTGPLSRTDADDAAFFLREFYEDQGFWEAEVDYSYDPSSSSASLAVSEGPSLYLGKISFDGSSHLPAERMTDIITASLRRSARSLTGKLRFVEFALEEAATALSLTFAQDGYRSAEVSVSSSPGKTRNTRDVIFLINEGPCYTLKEIHVSGYDNLPKNFFQSSLDHPYTPDEDTLLKERLLRHLRDQGFYAAQAVISASANPETGAVSLSLHTDTGPIYHLGTIHIHGQQQTQTSAILSTLGLRPGQPYTASRLREANRRLWFTGAFSKIDFTPIPQPDHSLLIDLALQEAKAKQLRATIGFSEWLLLYGSLDYTDRNLFGSLNHLNLKTTISTKGYSGEINLADPFLFQSELAGSIGLFYSNQTLPGYQSSTAGTVLGIERIFQTPNLTGFRLQYVLRNVFNTTIYGETPDLSQEKNYTIGMLAWNQTLDRRNDTISPMQGFLLKYDLALASQSLGGDLNFFQPSAQAVFYQPLKKITPERPFVPFCFINHKIGSIFPFANSQSIPTPERFFLGGPDSIRSFPIDRMPPSDPGGDPIGGEFFWQTNLEFQAPIWGTLYSVGFIDFANLALSTQNYSWDDTRIAPGIGMRFYTPIGAIRVDYGYNLIRKENDPTGALQFGFGFNF